MVERACPRLELDCLLPQAQQKHERPFLLSVFSNLSPITEARLLCFTAGSLWGQLVRITT